MEIHSYRWGIAPTSLAKKSRYIVNKMPKLSILLITSSMICFFFNSKIFIKSFNENNDSLSLEIYSKSKKCGFININTEGIVYQYSSGLYGKKGFIDLREAVFSYDNNIILINIKEGKNIISVKCSKNIYNETIFFLDNRVKIRNSPDYMSKRDLFFLN